MEMERLEDLQDICQGAREGFSLLAITRSEAALRNCSELPSCGIIYAPSSSVFCGGRGGWME